MRTTTCCVAVMLLALLLVGCGLMSPQQQSDALQAVDQMLRSGAITEAQHAAMREAILAASTTQWWAQAVTALAGAAIGHVTTMARRGPAATPVERQNRAAARKP